MTGYKTVMQGVVMDRMMPNDIVFHFRIHHNEESGDVLIGLILTSEKIKKTDRWITMNRKTRVPFIRNLLNREDHIKHDLNLRSKAWRRLRKSLEVFATADSI